MAKESKLSAEQQAEIEERRAAVAEERAREEAARKAAWDELDRSRKETEALRKTQEPSKEFVEAAKASKVRVAKERIDLHRKSYEAEAKRRNADEVMEKRFQSRNAAMLERHLALWADFQEATTGAEPEALREATRAMAHAWREKEEALVLLAVERKKKGGKKAKERARLEIETGMAKEKLEQLDRQRTKAIKPVRKKKKKA
jgi:hypothetical protein